MITMYDTRCRNCDYEFDYNEGHRVAAGKEWIECPMCRTEVKGINTKDID